MDLGSFAETFTGYRIEMTDTKAQAFADALNRLESDGDVEQFVTDQFAADAELSRPEADHGSCGSSTAVDFWPFSSSTPTAPSPGL